MKYVQLVDADVTGNPTEPIIVLDPDSPLYILIKTTGERKAISALKRDSVRRTLLASAQEDIRMELLTIGRKYQQAGKLTGFDVERKRTGAYTTKGWVITYEAKTEPAAGTQTQIRNDVAVEMDEIQRGYADGSWFEVEFKFPAEIPKVETSAPA